MYIVQKIIGKKINERNQTFYKIKWKGYPENQATWEPVRNVRGVQDMIQEFEIRNGKKMGERMGTHHYDRPRTTDISPERQKYRKEMVIDQPPVRLRNRSEESYENQPRKKLKKISAEEESQPDNKQRISEISEARQNTDMQPSQQNQQENDSGEYLQGVDLKELTAKINELANKKKWLRVVSMTKEDDGQFTYEVERQGGRLGRETREYLLNSYQDQLLEFYEKHITFQKSND